MPHSEIVTVRDQQGNIKTSTNPKAGAMSGADPVGEFIVGTAVGNLGLGLGKIAAPIGMSLPFLNNFQK